MRVPGTALTPFVCHQHLHCKETEPLPRDTQVCCVASESDSKMGLTQDAAKKPNVENKGNWVRMVKHLPTKDRNERGKQGMGVRSSLEP